PNSFVKSFFCEDIAGSCSQYYLNTSKYYYVRSAFRVVGIINTVEYDVFVWGLLVVVLYLVYIQSRRHRRDVARYVSTMIYAKRTLSVTPLLIVSILFTFTQCGLVSGGGKKGEAPWILLASGINNDTASVDEVTTGNTVTPSSPNAPIGSIPPTGSGNNTNGSGGYRPSGSGGYNGGSGGSALVPVTGMYFYIQIILGVLLMITDGRGNVIAGGNNGGKSHISYTPYGSIHRTDSSGPDITRFKYTGQEEDKESGLMYYKARYYDPMIGRFLQADSVVMPESTFGMNRYMYVSGSPTNVRDPSGHAGVSAMAGAIAGYFLASQAGSPFSGSEGAAIGAYMAGGNHRSGSVAKDMAGGARWAGRGIDHGARWAGTGIGNGARWAGSGIDHTVKWMSGGLKGAADQFNKMTNQDNEKRSRVNYSHCGVAGPYGYAVRLGAAPLTGLCLLATGIYEFGVRGGWEKISKAAEGAGGGASAGKLFTEPVVNVFGGTIGEGSTAAAVAAGFGYAAAAIAGVGFIMKQGDVKYQKIKDHRAYIQLLGCAYASRVAFSTDADMLLMGAFHCINESIKGGD
ncbi:MAG: RHS repeat-associated core domain-containing protein, partial [Leptospiraceae bacterium]|nr:RHS repeat-associated core domain-containing protein [Leptospiraceae bacterium]